MSTLYQNETYEFILKELKRDGQTGAEIVRRRIEDGEEIVLFSYYWPAQLSVEVEKGRSVPQGGRHFVLAAPCHRASCKGVWCREIHWRRNILSWRSPSAQRKRWSAGRLTS